MPLCDVRAILRSMGEFRTASMESWSELAIELEDGRATRFAAHLDEASALAERE